jgi:coenzyme F420-reducing hydrogenase delta subunit
VVAVCRYPALISYESKDGQKKKAQMKENNSTIYVFCCATSFDQAQLARDLSRTGNTIKIIPLPCSGKLDILYVIKAFETGADGVAVMMCKEGECRYLEGNIRARKRVEAVEELLKEAGMGGGRVAIIQKDDRNPGQEIKRLEGFCSVISGLSGAEPPEMAHTR